MEITVVGAGVIGLATAVALEEAGHQVRVVAEATGDRTTSAVAGAVWFPYRAGPPDKVVAWATRTRAWLVELASVPEAGIELLTGYEIDGAPAEALPPWWADGIGVERVAAPVTGAPLAWRFTAPRAEPATFLPWLARKLKRPIERRRVTDLAAEPGDVVVNCTGLGARSLVDDRALTALLGQVAIAAPGSIDRTVTLTDDRDHDRIFYIIPRRDELVLGGCSLPHDVVEAGADAPGADLALRARILEQAASLGLAVGDVREDRVGLRPYRREVRLERDPAMPRVIHNYGHGGAGFTLSRGCAEDVVALVG